MKKAIIFSMMLAACGAMAPQATAQRFAIKGYDNIGVGKAMTIDGQPGQTLDLPDVLMGIAVVAAVHLAGTEITHHFGEGDEHGLDNEEGLALLALGGGIGTVGQHI